MKTLFQEYKCRKIRSGHRRCSVRKGVLRNFAKFTGKYLCQSLFLNKVAGLRPAILFKKETLAQVFSCEFCKISKNTFFTEHLLAAASGKYFFLIQFTTNTFYLYDLYLYNDVKFSFYVILFFNTRFLL